MRAANSKPMFHSLTALRGLAAWWIVLYHFRQDIGLDRVRIQAFLSPGYLAVDLFFVMSGFVIALTGMPALRDPTLGRAMQFWALRLVRVYPLHLAVLLMMVINPVAIHFLSTAGGTSGRYALPYFLQSLLLIQNWGFAPEIAWNVPAWSISTEWAAYLLFPALAWLVSRLLTNAAASWAATGLMLLSVTAFGWFLLGLGQDIVHTGLPRCLLEFALGICLHQLWRHRAWWPHHALPAGGALLVAGCALGWPDYAFAPLAAVLLVLGSLRPGAGTWLLERPLLLWLGELSYATYIVHFFVRDWVKFLIIRPATPVALSVIAYMAAVLAASSILHRWVELPCRAYGRRLVLQAHPVPT